MARPDKPRRGQDSPNFRRKLRAVGIAIGLTLLALVASGIVGLAFAVPLLGLGYEFDSTAVLVCLLLGGQLGFIGVGYLYIRRYSLAVTVSTPDTRDVKYAVGGTVLALGFVTVSGFILESLGFTPESALEGFIANDPFVLILLAALSVVIVAPAEEYLFRGVIQRRLRITFAPHVAILLASLIFGTIHFGNWVGTPGTIIGWMLLISGVGVIFGVLYERTNNLVVPIVAHAAYNSFLFVTGYLLL